MAKPILNPLNCREVTTRLALGDLQYWSAWDRFMMRFHLAICFICSKYERQMAVIGQAFRVLAQQKVRADDFSKLKVRFIDAMRRF